MVRVWWLPVLLNAALIVVTVFVVRSVSVVDVQAQTNGACVHDRSHWHPPVENGCVYGHEHGDAPPQWIMDAGYSVGFDDMGGFHGGTSVLENTDKHISMKGMLAHFGRQDVYLRTHMTGTVMERSGQYHSYEVFMRDGAGGVSHWQGWFNSGSVSADRVSRSLPDPGRRPVVLVVDEPAIRKGVTCEQWYGFTAAWSWDIGLTICSPNSVYFPQESQYLDFFYDASWYGLANLGLDREIEATWYGPDSKVAPNRGAPPRGREFWATQFGQIVSGGPNDPVCSSMVTGRDGVARPALCLSQYISSTARAVENPGNRQRRTFDGTGVRVPN